MKNNEPAAHCSNSPVFISLQAQVQAHIEWFTQVQRYGFEDFRQNGAFLTIRVREKLSEIPNQKSMSVSLGDSEI